MRREIEETVKNIEATQPIVDAAIRRTDEKFIEVEEKTRRARLDLALIQDLEIGWKRHA
jgi:hypothetical protein